MAAPAHGMAPPAPLPLDQKGGKGGTDPRTLASGPAANVVLNPAPPGRLERLKEMERSLRSTGLLSEESMSPGGGVGATCGGLWQAVPTCGGRMVFY